MLLPETIAATPLAGRLPLTAYFASVTRCFHLAEDVFLDVSVKAVALRGDASALGGTPRLLSAGCLPRPGAAEGAGMVPMDAASGSCGGGSWR